MTDSPLPTHPHAPPLATPLFFAAGAVLAASVAGQVIGAQQGAVGMSAFAAAAFTGAMLRLGWTLNRPWWQCETSTCLGPDTGGAQPVIAARNAQLLALGYVWGGISLLAVYLLSGIKWQHGWQYGSGMVLIGALLLLAARALPKHWGPVLARRLAGLTLIHGWAATGGLAWLVGSGKIWSIKGDWAANVVFAAGAVALVGVSAMALRTARILAEAPQTSALTGEI